MVTLRLTRTTTSMKYGTFGILDVNGWPQCVTLEPAWLENISMISSIPNNTYKLVWYDSKRYGRTLMVKDVPRRYGILFHQGNLQKNTSGCILVGEKFGELSCAKGILNSRKALKSLLFKLEKETDMRLIITEAY